MVGNKPSKYSYYLYVAAIMPPKQFQNILNDFQYIHSRKYQNKRKRDKGVTKGSWQGTETPEGMAINLILSHGWPNSLFVRMHLL